jgi:hypothetical protein
MRLLTLLFVFVLSAGVVADEKKYKKDYSRDKIHTKGDTHDGDMLMHGVRSTLYAMDAIFDLKGNDKTKIVVTNTYQQKDDHDTTIGCYGIPAICDVLPDIIDIVMDDGDAWHCVSVPGGVECTHQPH